MNRNNNDSHTRKNHYADFDEFGNKRDDSRRNNQQDSWNNQMSRANYRSAGQDQRDERNYFRHESRGSNDYNHPNFGARAYGDMSGGTSYGEGGSTYGGGSAYGHSNYGFEGEHGPYNAREDRNRSEDVRNGYGDYIDYNSRNYGSFGGNNYSGYMNHERNYGDRDNRGYGSTGRENTGYDRGFNSYGRTGYGSTGFNNRDMDRESNAYSNRTFSGYDQHRNSGHGQDYNTRGRGNNDTMRRERDAKW